MAFKNVEPKVWKHEEEGDFVEGFYISMKEEAGEYKSNAYNLESKNGERWVVFGNNVLNDKMGYVKIGDLIKIVFVGKGGEAKAGKERYNIYDVLIDDGKGEEDTE